MTSNQSRTVQLADLTLGNRLGQGGQGVVHQVADRRITETGESWKAVYKEYSPAMLPELDAGALHSMAALLDGLDGAQARWLCKKLAWPTAVVEDQGHARGFLMRSVPNRFRIEIAGLTAASGRTRRLAAFEYLLNEDAYVARIGVKISEKDRVLLLADLADVLARLHRLGIAVGDLSPKNLLFTLDGRPECFLIDCDAMRLRSASVLPQAETPDWQVPAGEEKGTRFSDMYKFGLLAVRLFARDQTATDPEALSGLGSRLRDLARASLQADPHARPTPVAWADALVEAAATASKTPAKAPSTSSGRRTRAVATPVGRLPAPVPAVASAPVAAPVPTPPPTAAAVTAPAKSTSTPAATPKGNPDPLGELRGLIHFLALIALWNGYTKQPWINLPGNGGILTFHEADTLTLSLFVKAFWMAVAGVFVTAWDDDYGPVVIGAILGFVSFVCFMSGYARLEHTYGVFNVSPMPGFGLCVAASVAAVVIGIWKCVVISNKANP